MRCLGKIDSKRWCEAHYSADDLRHSAAFGQKYSVRAPISGMNWSWLHWFGGFLASNLEPFEECLLLVTQWGVWPSSENLHLFHRMRESYGENRPIEDAPGHLFMKHERADLVTFIELALLSGWDFYLLPMPICRTAFVSHDEFVELQMNNLGDAKQAAQALPGAIVNGES